MSSLTYWLAGVLLGLRRRLAMARERQALRDSWLHVRAAESARQDAAEQRKRVLWCDVEQAIRHAEHAIKLGARQAPRQRRFVGGWKPSRART